MLAKDRINKTPYEDKRKALFILVIGYGVLLGANGTTHNDRVQIFNHT